MSPTWPGAAGQSELLPLLPAVLVAAAVALLARPRPAAGRIARPGAADPPGRRWRRRRGGAAATAVVAAVLLLHGRTLLQVLLAAAVLLGSRRLLARQRTSRDAALASARVMEFCETIAAELTAGQDPTRALTTATREFGEFAPVAVAATLGSDVPAALRELSERPGCADLRLVAAAWHVARRSGAGMAESLERIGRTVRERRRTSRLVAAELASAQATARVMAALPVVMLVAGSGLGGDPLAFLLGTTAGTACLVVGLGLSFLGLLWLQHIASGVETG